MFSMLKNSNYSTCITIPWAITNSASLGNNSLSPALTILIPVLYVTICDVIASNTPSVRDAM